MKTLIRARYVIASDGQSHHILENGEVVYEGDTILFAGHNNAEPVDEVIDAGNAIVGPGFIDLDALFDLDSTVLGFDSHPGWAKARVWASTYVDRGPRDVYTPDEEQFQHEYAMIQLLLNGITTALPIRSILYREWAETYEENARAAEAAAKIGIRMYLGPSYRTGLPVVYPDGSFGMHWDEERGLRGLDDAIQFVRDFDGAHNGLIRGFLQPDRIEGCTEELLTRTAAAGEELDCPVRLHCCQGELELKLVEERWGKSSLSVLRDLGFLSHRALLPHGSLLGGVRPTPEKIETELGWLADAGVAIVHCPLVMARGGGAMNSFPYYHERGVNIGLGTDTFPPDMILNMHVGTMVTRIRTGGPTVSAADYYTAATIDGANAIGRPDLGRLAAGAKADITVFDLSAFHMGQVVDPIQTMVLNGSGRDFTTVIVNGRTVIRDRQVDGYDLRAMHTQAQQQYEKLMASYPERSHLHPPVEEIFQPSFPTVGRGTA
ncbi:MAG: amidohydrolase family protein [Thermomicrobiales bacterium]